MLIQALTVAASLLTGAPFPAEEWDRATMIAEDHKTVWYEVFGVLDVDPIECEAIIFPELLRYSRFQDGAQTGALMSLYVSGGTEASNYSVGYFQMKPSFIEEIELAWMDSPQSDVLEIYFPMGDRRDVRRRRVSRIRDEKWQCVYLALFVRMMLEREPSLREMPPEERIRYLATAYNHSFGASLSQLRKRMRLKTFHLGIIQMKSTHLYNYPDLSIQRYRELKRNNTRRK